MQTKPPKSNYIDFLNWEEFIGAKDGISNLVKRNVTCIPNEWNTFFVTSIKINGCKYSSNGNFNFDEKYYFTTSMWADIYKIQTNYLSINFVRCGRDGSISEMLKTKFYMLTILFSILLS